MRYEFQNDTLNTLFILTRSCLVLTQVETLQKQTNSQGSQKKKEFVYVSYSYIIKNRQEKMHA